ncbi:MAG: TIGR03619 family F420-dependent LLM class oxidoreductase [Candidatus Tectomicrobia bacterium]|uniref:TIGR03619 family F420-dependent LLM class oxidoreductase n=1 Tax=Tectimicrobiota bacterium TaxID=2528274 RepID=A0A937VX34_UNCTE|nr:TIGR03619 family F420-dependent LLM class oxidoreductase [Candidatus Tectomicrobia bacterium]
MVQFSFRPPGADYLGFEATPEGIVETACQAETLGFDAILVNDHIIVDGSPRAVTSWGNTYDPLIVLSYIAARTTRIRLGTSVLIMPYRNPVATAKMLATLDQMSGGRLIAGVGAGWCEAEFAALGVPFHERGARTTEYLRIWQACWAPDPVTFEGQFFAFRDMYTKPKPVQQPHPPLWIGGSGRPSLRRAAAFAQVWQPTPMALADLCACQNYLRAACDQIGRQEVPGTRMSFRVNFSAITGSKATAAERPVGQGTPVQVAEDMRRFRGRGRVGGVSDQFQWLSQSPATAGLDGVVYGRGCPTGGAVGARIESYRVPCRAGTPPGMVVPSPGRRGGRARVSHWHWRSGPAG